MKKNDVTGMILDRMDCDGSLAEMTEQAEIFLKKHISFMGIRSKEQEYSLHPIETKAIIYMQLLPGEKGVELGIKGNLSKKAVEYNIAKLKENGLLERKGPDRGGYWKVVESEHYEN